METEIMVQNLEKAFLILQDVKYDLGEKEDRSELENTVLENLQNAFDYLSVALDYMR